MNVIIPTDVEYVAYSEFNTDDENEWDRFLEDTRNKIENSWPSMRKADRWLDSENHVIMVNDLAVIGMSVHGNTAAIWLSIKTPKVGYYCYTDIADIFGHHWASQIRNKFMDMFETKQHSDEKHLNWE